MGILDRLLGKHDPLDAFGKMPNTPRDFIVELSRRKFWRDIDKRLLEDIAHNAAEGMATVHGAAGEMELLRNFVYISEQFQLVGKRFVNLASSPEEFFGAPLSGFAVVLYNLGSAIFKQMWSSVDPERGIFVGRQPEELNAMSASLDMAFTSAMVCDPFCLQAYAGMAAHYGENVALHKQGLAADPANPARERAIGSNRAVALDWCQKYRQAEQKLLRTPDERLNPWQQSAKRLLVPGAAKSAHDEMAQHAPGLLSGPPPTEGSSMRAVIEELERTLAEPENRSTADRKAPELEEQAEKPNVSTDSSAPQWFQGCYLSAECLEDYHPSFQRLGKQACLLNDLVEGGKLDPETARKALAAAEDALAEVSRGEVLGGLSAEDRSRADWLIETTHKQIADFRGRLDAMPSAHGASNTKVSPETRMVCDRMVGKKGETPAQLDSAQEKQKSAQIPAQSPMKMKVKCPHCGRMLNVPIRLAGQTGKCPACSSAFSVPEAPASENRSVEPQAHVLAGTLAELVERSFESPAWYISKAGDELVNSPILEVLSKEEVADMDATFAALSDQENTAAQALRRELEMLIVVSIHLAVQSNAQDKSMVEPTLDEFYNKVMLLHAKSTWTREDLEERFKAYAPALHEKDVNIGVRFNIFYHGGNFNGGKLKLVLEGGAGLLRMHLAQSVFGTFFNFTQELLEGSQPVRY